MLNLTVHRREAVYLFACVSTICTFRIALDENSESSMFGQVTQTAEIGMSKVSFTHVRCALLRCASGTQETFYQQRATYT